MKKVGILYDNISGNTGDVAIGLSLKKILRSLNVAFDELVPGNFNPLEYETIIVGGGHLLRPSPDFFYDKFRVPGNHVLNAMGIVGEPQDLDYLNNYHYITVRSNGDKLKLAYLKRDVYVVPCTSMLLEDLVDFTCTLKTPCIGMHILPFFSSFQEEDAFVQWVSSLPFTIYFLPITHYNRDIDYMRQLLEKIPNAELLPILKAEEVFTLIGRFDFFISCSLHGAIFAYSHNVPFVLYNYSDKMQFFMEDRGLEQFLFKNFNEMRIAYEVLQKEKPDYSEKISDDKKVLKEYIDFLKTALPLGNSYTVQDTDCVGQTNHQINFLLRDVSDFERKKNELLRQVNQLEKYSADRDHQIRQLLNQVRLFQKENEAIKRSIIYKTTTKIHSTVIERLFRPNTRRRRYYDLGLNGGRVLLNEGAVSFFHKFKCYLSIENQSNINKWHDEHTLTKEELKKYKDESGQFLYRPKFSIILPVWNTNKLWLRNALDSVLNQCYENWELCVADDGSTDPAVKVILQEFQAKDSRIKVIFLDENRGVSGASNRAIFQSVGDYIGFLDHDDELTPDALYEVARFLNEKPDTDFIYSDELIVNEKGRPSTVCYRPDFSLDYLLSHPYFVHFVAIRAGLVKSAGGFREDFPISQDYDLFLRIIKGTDKIAHIPKILYHWRNHPTSAGHALQNKVSIYSRKAIKEFIDHRGIEGDVFDTENFNFYRVKRTILDNPRISIIIPIRDRVDLLRKCIDSILAKTTYNNYELLIVDNCSREKETRDYLADLKNNNQNIRIIDFPEEFNFSKINNTAAGFATGEHFLFLNNDIEIITPDWIEALLEQSQRTDVCCVGGKLLYPDETIQHVGVVIGLCGPAEHVYKFYDSHDIGYMGNFTSIRNYSAVTGACMMIKKRTFNEIGGFDEKFVIGFGDTDLCLRGLEKGYLNVFTPFAELYHWESATRGKSYDVDNHPNDTARFCERWQNFIKKGDPYYNSNIPLCTLDIRPFIIIE